MKNLFKKTWREIALLVVLSGCNLPFNQTFDSRIGQLVILNQGGPYRGATPNCYLSQGIRGTGTVTRVDPNNRDLTIHPHGTSSYCQVRVPEKNVSFISP